MSRGWGSTRRWRQIRQAMINRALGTPCPLCHTPLLPQQRLHLDHVLPRAAGGPDLHSNLQVTHARCNLAKGAKPPRTQGYESRLSNLSRDW
jgi:5-methylcytosine-specific restriction endonuclease McrA